MSETHNQPEHNKFRFGMYLLLTGIFIGFIAGTLNTQQMEGNLPAISFYCESGEPGDLCLFQADPTPLPPVPTPNPNLVLY